MGKASRTKTSAKPIIITKQRNWFPWIITGISVLVVIAITLTVIFINQSNKPGEQATIAPQGVANDGYVVTTTGLDITLPQQKVNTTLEASTYDSTTNNLSIYLDYSCTHCADFEQANFDQAEQWLQEGTIDSLTLHPVAFLTPYSANAANALACVAQNDPTNILNAHKTLMNNWDQGLSNKEILPLLEEAGVNQTDAFTNCVKASTYADFVTQSTERARSGPIPNSSIENIQGTPTILLNGQKYPGDPADNETFTNYVLTNLNTNQTPETTTP